MPDKTCNAKFDLANGETVTPCHLSKGHQGDHYGTCLGSVCHWPQGVDSEEELARPRVLTGGGGEWPHVIANRFGKAYGEQSFNNAPLEEVISAQFRIAARATHNGLRIETRGQCEKCNTPTNWIVNVMGRAAYWCGCA